MSYIKAAQLTDQHIQALIARNGFTDVSTEYPDRGLYSIADLEGNIYSMGSMESARGWLVEQYHHIQDVLYPTDQVYPDGTVLCPDASSKWVRCVHDNCPFALVYSGGTIITSGSVVVRTALDIHPRTLVVSDGRGGVRPISPGDRAFVLGFSITSTVSAQVSIVLRSFSGVVS